MKKLRNTYVAIWAVLFVLFQVIAFVSVGWEGQEKYTASFWIGYGLITLCFVCQLACAWRALGSENKQKTFYNLSLITTSYTGLILSFIFGGLCMLLSPLPYWVGILLCAIVLAGNVLSVIKASAAIELVSEMDEKVKTWTFFIRSLTVDVENLMARARSEAVKSACKKVYEVVRYSDPMSDERLATVESEITVKVAKLTDAVASDASDLVNEIADDVVILLGDRNRKCKLLK